MGLSHRRFTREFKLAAVQRLVEIVRNRLKIEATVKNARAFLAVHEAGSLRAAARRRVPAGMGIDRRTTREPSTEVP